MKIMKLFWRYHFSFFIYLLLVMPFATWGSGDENLQDFLHCISLFSANNDSNSTLLIHTPSSSSYSSVLNFSIRNLRFSEPNTPKPVAIITPSASQVQAAVICCKNHGLQIRTRSGGHDFEGRSYVSNVPFVLIDLINLNSVSIDTKDNTAWVQSGTTIGKLYYEIGEKSDGTLEFPAGFMPTIGVGGFLSGAGFGMMVKKYGLGVDNVVDAYVVDANEKVVDRESMGEDLFWAIRGGGGGSFGIVLAWKLKLVQVPPIVTSFARHKQWDQNAAKLIHQWQYVAPETNEDLFNSAWITASNSSDGSGRIMEASLIFSLFLGNATELLSLMKKTFPKLGLKKEDCQEMSWVESMAFMASRFVSAESLEVLLHRITPLSNDRSKTKSDYATQPILEPALEGMWKRFRMEGLQTVQLILIPFGGKMNEISETETPSPHRARYPIHIGYYVTWQRPDADSRHLEWTRELHDYMTPFVSKSPRAAYVNYKDLDIETNNEDGIVPTSYEEASIWGHPYFGNNFDRLVEVKTKVDPFNFFRHEQSIPPAASTGGIQANITSCPDVPYETMPYAIMQNL